MRTLDSRTLPLRPRQVQGHRCDQSLGRDDRYEHQHDLQHHVQRFDRTELAGKSTVAGRMRTIPSRAGFIARTKRSRAGALRSRHGRNQNFTRRCQEGIFERARAQDTWLEEEMGGKLKYWSILRLLEMH